MAHLTQLAQLRRRVSRVPTVSCNFFIGTILDFLYQTDRLPFFAPADGRATGDSLGLSFCDEVLGLKLGWKEGEEDLLLVKGFDGRKGDTLGTFDELIGLCHMEDQFVSYEFGGLIIQIRTEERLSAVTLSSQRTNSAESREDHGDALDMDGHAEDNGVEVFAEHADEGRVCGLEVLPETIFLLCRQLKLTRVRK